MCGSLVLIACPLPIPPTPPPSSRYGLIYHASLVGQAAPKNKGKISRVLAAKCALAIRVDALGETEDTTVGNEGREKVEARMRQLEGLGHIGATGGAKYVRQQHEGARRGRVCGCVWDVG